MDNRHQHSKNNPTPIVNQSNTRQEKHRHAENVQPEKNSSSLNYNDTDKRHVAPQSAKGGNSDRVSSAQHANAGDSSHPPTVIPPGVLAIYHACSKIYPNQPNPLQVTTLKKYWVDGPDPLDYISMYENLGDESRHIPAHWHYVSLGLSDLHGDGRVHDRASADEVSGYGFELTFRLKREAGETGPPTWPAVLMQALARYVFQTGNILQGGDHVSWHSPLDNTESRIQHMLMAEDAQLPPAQSPFGYINFIQIVGVCAEELKAAQHWNGPGVLELLRNISSAGGPWLITDMRRGETIFELDPSFQEKLEQGIEQEGSNLSGVSGFVHWEEVRGEHHSNGLHATHSEQDTPHLSATDTEKIKSMLEKGLRSNHHQPHQTDESKPADDANGSEHRKGSSDSSHSVEHPAELIRTRTLDGLHLKFNAETGSLLPLAIRGRLRHGRHFTFKSAMTESAVTLVSPSVAGAFVDNEHRFAIHGLWLQVLLDDQFIERLSQQLDFLSELTQVSKPEVFSWPEHQLTISILPDTMVGLGSIR